MLSTQIRDRINNFILALDAEADFFELVASLAARDRQTSRRRDDILRNLDVEPVGREASVLRDEVLAATEELRPWRPRQVFAVVDRLDRAAFQFYGADPHNQLSMALARLLEAYEATIQGHRYYDVGYLLRVATDLHSVARNAKDSVRHVADMLISMPAHLIEDDQRLTITLTRETALDEFAAKISAVATLYDEVASLVASPGETFAPRIIKIESGSALIDILGVPRVIKLVADLIEGAADWLYRNYTREGRIVALPRAIDSIDAVLGLRGRLRDSGIPTEELDERIAKATVIIATELNVLLSAEPSVTVNQRTLSVGAAVEERYLREGSRRQIESGETGA